MSNDYFTYFIIAIFVSILVISEILIRKRLKNNRRVLYTFDSLRENKRIAILLINKETGFLRCVFSEDISTGDRGKKPLSLENYIHASESVIACCHDGKTLSDQEYLDYYNSKPYDPHER